MLELYRRKQFDKDVKLLQKRGKKIDKLWDVVGIILSGKSLPAKNKNHKLIGNFEGFWDCHIEPDWILIYELTNEHVTLIRTGTHSDLF